MIKQITDQLELPLECVYQMTLIATKTAKRIAKNIPNMPAMIQLCLEFDRKQIGKLERLKWIALGILGSAGLATGAAAIAQFFG